MYGDVPKMIPARMAAPLSRTTRHASRYAQKPFIATDASVVTFSAVATEKRPSTVAPMKAGSAVCVCSVRSAPPGARRYDV